MKKHAPLTKPPDREECLAMARQCLSHNLRRTERLITRHYDSYLADAGVTAVQLPMLAIIGSAEEPTFRLLTKELELDRSTLSRNLALLERMGLVDIGEPSGPKPGLIKLTRKGKNALRIAHDQWQHAHRELLALLDQDSYTSGLSFLKKLRGNARSTIGTR